MNEVKTHTKLYLRDEFQQAWQGKDSFACANGLEGEVFRALEQRRTLSFVLDGSSYFIKIHKGVRWAEIIKNLVQLRLPVVSAKNEWLALHALTALDITTLVPVGYGLRGRMPATIESFLITEDVGPNQSLEELCEQWPINKPQLQFKHKLIITLATTAKKMHENGICHRDFYICHFLLSPGDEFKLTLIDLHRALIKKNLTQRWRVKDIGGLYFSALNIGLTKRDLFRFMKAYSGKSLRLTLSQDKVFWEKVASRALTTG